MKRLRRTLGLLQRGSLWQLRAEHERAEHVAQLLDAELVLDRLNTCPVHDYAERLKSGAEPAANLFNRPQGAVGGRDREQARFGDHGHPVAGSPRRAGEGVQRRRAVDEHEIVVGLDVGERLFKLPNIADARMRPVEINGRRAPDHDVDLARTASGPAAGRYCRANDLFFRRSQYVCDVEVAGDINVHAGRNIRLGVKIDHERAHPPRERRRRQSKRDCCLTYSTLEGAHAENMHNKKPYLQYSERTQHPTTCVPDRRPISCADSVAA